VQCRRAGEFQQKLTPKCLEDIGEAADRIWKHCSTRRDYSKCYFGHYYIFTSTSSVKEVPHFSTKTPYDEFEYNSDLATVNHYLEIYLGKSLSEYVVPYARNLPDLTNLSLGQINISRDILKAVLAATATVYVTLHSPPGMIIFHQKPRRFFGSRHL
jgi:hypothetical protein